ncbi:phosphoadenosine phosphosulfate reductase family protein [Tardiphaga sp. 709]|uniref:phosphoadenosine phosphosulfate reductase family protein n=1 Tax=Tardiphaga sp. 709 TaxID=3076039 RepID=UPI0028E26E76|nr:phosphoadenosine phosphosulfate reductase family protein [Tardiphaga sp. 709]WNV10725.1 phosphoadenosine phosphosulfate reductase family protein [Tardiphaga sp. 709]
MSTTHNIVSVSGGKDSTALLLLAIERGAENLQAVFADTGHEHPQTYEYIQYLNDKVFPIRTIKADYTEAIENRRRFMERVIAGEHKERAGSRHTWTPEVATQALEYLKPTGNPFLDMCLVHGRFPSTRVRFCSEELKRNPLLEQVHMPLMEAGHVVISWQGVRADESRSRAALPERDLVGGGADGGELWNYRPILQWNVEQVFAMHDKHGVAPNPLYKQGMGRVGCMPCIHATKNELLEVANRFPEELERVARWESLVMKVSKTETATFFAMDKTGWKDGRTALDATPENHGIHAVVQWAKTSRGGKQFDFFRVGGEQEEGPLCSSIYGLCE